MPNDWCFRVGIDRVNGYELEQFVREFHLSRKLKGKFHDVQSASSEQSPSNVVPMSSSCIYTLLDFLKACNGAGKEGRIRISRVTVPDDESAVSRDAHGHRHGHGHGDWQLSYILLDCGTVFQEFLSLPKSIILMGGTLPSSNFLRQSLFPGLDEASRALVTFQCGHVLQPNHLSIALHSQGPNGISLSLTKGNQGNAAMIQSYGLAVLEYAQVIPDGLVVFFPSYEWMRVCLEAWARLGTDLERYKKIFVEPRAATVLPSFLESYRGWLDARPRIGALLFAVMGGRLSEGINFSDAYGRGILILGLPVPNIGNVELVERMNYYEQASCGQLDRATYLDELTMTTVNQSIGRVIRHRRDFAVVALVDARYGQSRYLDRLPRWMRPYIVPKVDDWTVCTKRTETFFKQKER